MNDQGKLFEIETAPRFSGDVTPIDVLHAWVDRARGASVVNPRKEGEPYRQIQIPDIEYRCLLRLLAAEPGDGGE